MAAILLVTNYSCKDDNEEPNRKQIIIDKTWKLSTIETEKDNAEFEGFMTLMLTAASMEYDFKSDGTYQVTIKPIMLGETETDSGVWSISDDYKTITIDGSAGNVVECTESSMKLEYISSPSIIDEDLSNYDTGVLTFVFKSVN